MLGRKFGHVVTQETRDKIRAKLLGRKLSSETRLRMSQKIVSSETRKKMSLRMMGNTFAVGSAGWHHTEEAKKRISESHAGKLSVFYGKSPTWLTRKKMSESHLKLNRKGPNHPSWVSVPRSKLTIHRRIEYLYGKADRCENPCCSGKSKRFDWSNKEHKYTMNREDWQRLCRSCHMLYDFGKNFKKGVGCILVSKSLQSRF